MNKESIVLSIVAMAGGSFLLNLAIASIILPSRLSSSEPQGLKQRESESRAINDPSSVPKDTCGNPYDPSVSAWYPVFLDGANVDDVRNNLCRDATKR
jgi:hypothetical protein